MNPQNIYYQQQHSEYQLTMNKPQFHDSGIVDEGLSDETGSIEDESNQQENHTDSKDIPKKPSQSYLEIIAEAILKAPNRTMQLYEIYNYFQRKYRYFAEEVNKSWRNSVRHNLSLNECFVKAGRGANGKGHFWRIHELAERDFEQGRFRRRRYRQEMRQLQMHQSPYDTHSMSSIYPPSSYYMCSPPPPPPPYHTIYSNPNISTEKYPINSPESSTSFCMTSSTPTSSSSLSYPFYDPYSTSYYPTGYEQHHPMTLSYTSPNESDHFDA